MLRIVVVDFHSYSSAVFAHRSFFPTQVHAMTMSELGVMQGQRVPQLPNGPEHMGLPLPASAEATCPFKLGNHEERLLG